MGWATGTLTAGMLSDADWLAMYQDQVVPVVQASRTLLSPMIASGGGTLVTTAA